MAVKVSEKPQKSKRLEKVLPKRILPALQEELSYEKQYENLEPWVKNLYGTQQKSAASPEEAFSDWSWKQNQDYYQNLLELELDWGKHELNWHEWKKGHKTRPIIPRKGTHRRIAGERRAYKDEFKERKDRHHKNYMESFYRGYEYPLSNPKEYYKSFYKKFWDLLYYLKDFRAFHARSEVYFEQSRHHLNIIYERIFEAQKILSLPPEDIKKIYPAYSPELLQRRIDFLKPEKERVEAKRREIEFHLENYWTETHRQMNLLIKEPWVKYDPRRHLGTKPSEFYVRVTEDIKRVIDGINPEAYRKHSFYVLNFITLLLILAFTNLSNFNWQTYHFDAGIYWGPKNYTVFAEYEQPDSKELKEIMEEIKILETKLSKLKKSGSKEEKETIKEEIKSLKAEALKKQQLCSTLLNVRVELNLYYIYAPCIDWKSFFETEEDRISFSQAPLGSIFKEGSKPYVPRKGEVYNEYNYYFVAPYGIVGKFDGDISWFNKNWKKVTPDDLTNTTELASALTFMARGHGSRNYGKLVPKLKNIYTVMALQFEELLGVDFLNFDQEAIEYLNSPDAMEIMLDDSEGITVSNLTKFKERLIDKDRNGNFKIIIILINDILDTIELHNKLRRAGFFD